MPSKITALTLPALTLMAACDVEVPPPSTGMPSSPGIGAGGLPRVNATCPLGISVHADQHGPVFINGREAELQKFSDSYYEARRDGVAISLTLNPDRTTSVSYTAPGGANGICTVAR